MAGSDWSAPACLFGLLPCQYLSTANVSSVPSFVLDYAPIVYLHSTEKWFPGPIAAQLEHTRPEINSTAVKITPPVLNVNSMSWLNSNENASKIALSSVDDFTKYPSWLHGTKPDSSGRTPGPPSSAIITRDVGNGTLFAFYTFFYPFNFGLLGTDNHVGDWEHVALRFDDESPTQAWYSQHSGGTAYTFDALQKEGRRPIVYSGNGTHASYPKDGDHTVLGLATDKTDKGTKWDPTLAAYLVGFTPDSKRKAHGIYSSFRPGDTTLPENSYAAVDWLYYLGIWGDDQLPKSDPRQVGSGSLARWTAGPTGPQDKNLARNQICPDGQVCRITSNISQSTG